MYNSEILSLYLVLVSEVDDLIEEAIEKYKKALEITLITGKLLLILCP